MDSLDDTYENGYSIGFEEGKSLGYTKGYEDCNEDYEPRLAKYWAEIQTMTARISYLERTIGISND